MLKIIKKNLLEKEVVTAYQHEPAAS